MTDQPDPSLPRSVPPFAGLRVVDVSSGIAGAYAAKVLADLGARVAAVEATGGSPLRRRRAAPEPVPAGEAPLWRHLRSRVAVHEAPDPVDLDDPVVAALVADAHLVIDDRVPVAGVHRMRDWQRHNPDRIVVSVTPYGLEGPWAERPATGFTAEVDSGAVDRRGAPPRPPVPVGGDLVDWLAGSFAALGAASAWRLLRHSGVGQLVDVSMLEAAVTCLNGPYRVMSAQWFAGMTMPRAIEVPSIEPATDGPVGFCTQTAQQWSDFCAMIGRPDLSEDPTFNQADARMAAIDLIRSAISDFCSTRTVDEIVELAAAMRIPVTPVGTGATVWGFDQLAARDVYSVDADGLRRPRPPFRFSRSVLAGRDTATGFAGDGDGAAFDADADADGETLQGTPADAPDPADLAAGAGGAPPPRPFVGLRVVDLTAFWAGPFVTQYLGALGADVIKIESIQRPDGIRFLGSFDLDAPWERSFVFHGVNTDKRDVTLDLSTPAGREALDRLLEGADLLVENFTPRVLENFAISWDELHLRHPGLIMVRMPAFGLDGPWRDRAGFAMTIEQTSGLAWTTGYDDLPLVPRGPCDPVGGVHALIAIHAALAERDRSGVGQHVEVPLLEVACNIAAEAVLEHSAHGIVLDRSTPPATCPRVLVACAGEDQWLGIDVADDDQWRALCTAVAIDGGARDGAASDPVLDPDLDLAARRSRADGIRARIAAWSVELPVAEAERRLLDAGIPAAAMRRSGAIVEHPQFAARRVLQRFEHPVTGEAGYPNFPLTFSAWGPHLLSRRPPLLGEHTREVLGELGYDDPTLDQLEADRVIGTRPAWL
jgi:crotonobetainyl-CoA:carnitine CoA-transferase CaiB-like acyl-CoA transferase